MRSRDRALRALMFLVCPRRPATGRLVAATLCAITAIAGVSGCTHAQRAGDASSYLIINSLTGASGADPDKFSATVGSDVLTLVKASDSDIRVPTVFADPGQVSVVIAMKDPGSTTSPSQPSVVNWITISRYHVQFIRTDGRNTPGVDVPYPFDGVMTLTVNDGGASGGFTLVRIQAKAEAPLKALVNRGAGATISTIAEVTFYGADQAGRVVSVTGRIGVDFSDWGDPQ